MQDETFIHPLAIVEPGAGIGAGVQIGPFCHVGPDVTIGDGTRLISHVVVAGATTIGRNCTIHPQAVLGGPPQSTGHKGGRTTLTIGDNCIIREFVSMNTGTDFGRGATTVGDNGHFLAYVHIAHDCAIGNNVTMTNGVTLAGHIEVGDFVGIGGLSAIHQFVRIGHNAFIAGGSMILGDVIPYAMVGGNRATLRGMNVVGMKRSGVPKAEILKLRRAYRILFDRTRPLAENIERVREEFADSVYSMKVVDFMLARGKRQFTLPPLKGAADDDADGQD
ncbi:acyl-ACP--UDP-N-acetylglucosamine O-acyltransferase [Mesorhizobium sp. LHD-90]|uniref:acyl-ACP--UDP-N-acetylglucosamine O-acyltransferase n=1 Tax=Mesorhizobium sp. LHD-90 TaxID=3071414 RepID=UPI0027E083D7|nr:acyl-ACP--UDP-N-acetylglucosamine O-acyltransferase [Mesorhizobium sp. LHD-90]MDQ6437126.1 acyl-ACP--UDP-N-acetylglucosamine O-acyltransferase [Mesorhizobium sp. LHD-90]